MSTLCKSSDRSLSWQWRSFWLLASSSEHAPEVLVQARSQELEAFLRYAVRPDVRPQPVGNHDSPVRLLVILDHRHPGPAHLQSAAVHRVHELSLILALG